MEKKTVEFRVGKVYLRDDGIMQVDAYPDSKVTLADAIEAIKAQAIVAEGQKRALMVNMNTIKSMERDARVYFGGDVAQKNVTCTALVISSSIGKVIANFMIGLNKASFPTRVFTSEADALKWLKLQK